MDSVMLCTGHCQKITHPKRKHYPFLRPLCYNQRNLLAQMFWKKFSIFRNLSFLTQIIRAGICAVLILPLLLSAQTLKATSECEMSGRVKKAYQYITSLRMNDAQMMIDEIKQREPHNALVFYLENYQDFFTVFIKEEEQDYISFIHKRDKRLGLIAQSDQTSPYYLFCQAEMILQSALVKLKFDEKVSAAHDIYKAYKMLEENKKLFPGFSENNKSLCVIYALAESLPQWTRKLLGIKGSVYEATVLIQELTEKANRTQSMYKDEIVAVYAYILFYVLRQEEEAYQLFTKYSCDHTVNPLLAFMKATFAQKTGKTALALRILDERPRGDAYMDFYYLDFLYGKYKLYQMDKDAHRHIIVFTTHFKGRHYIREAYQKLAWYHLIVQNDPGSYRTYMAKVRKNGYSQVDEDVQALKEAEGMNIPDPILLTSRLLYDGGFLNKAMDILKKNQHKYTRQSNHDGEFYYRMGRICDGLHRYDEALGYYKTAIAQSNPDKYYACSASLQSGIIYEKKKNKQKAEAFYRKCLTLHPDEYATSLHQKAQTGLQRLK